MADPTHPSHDPQASLPDHPNGAAADPAAADPAPPRHAAREATQRALAPLREQIDTLDQKLVELLNERARVVVEVGRVKRDAGEAIPIYAPTASRRSCRRSARPTAAR